MDLAETDDQLVLRAYLPGMERDDAKSVTARFENGVLEVRMPKPEESKATRIEIATEAVEVESGEKSAEHSTGSKPVGAAA